MHSIQFVYEKILEIFAFPSVIEVILNYTIGLTRVPCKILVSDVTEVSGISL